MDFKELIRKSRSCRRFYQHEPMDEAVVRSLIDCARLAPSSGNIQALKFFYSVDPWQNDLIFSQLKWASYLKDWPGPVEGERPAAYIIILGDSRIHQTIEVDVGIAAQSIMLASTAAGFGGCMIASVNREVLREKLHIPSCFQIPLVIALGKPKEIVVIEELPSDGRIEYWRDANGVHHVPKRSLDQLAISRFTE